MQGNLLSGKKIVVMGVANKRSIAWGCAQSLQEQGADVIYTYQNDVVKQHIAPLIGDSLCVRCDVTEENGVKNAFATIQEQCGTIDGVIHAIAYADKESLHGGLLKTTKTSYNQALDISAYSFMEVARYAAPLMKQGGSLVTLTYMGATRAVPHYNIMGVAKAALESEVRYLAHELGKQQIRVNAISAGAIKTLAVTGVDHYRELLKVSKELTVDEQAVTLAEIGNVAAFLMSPLSTGMTGDILFVDKGVHTA